MKTKKTSLFFLLKIGYFLNMKLKQKMSQKLFFSQNMKQSLKILSLSNAELAEDIQKEVLENPLLEIDQKNEDDSFLNVSFRIYDSLESSAISTKRQTKITKESIFKEDFWIPEEDLKNFLVKQKEQSFYSKEIKNLIKLLISYIDERAYLTVCTEELAKKNRIPVIKMREALEALQSFEPYGVGARSLEECLLIQIKQKGLEEPKLIEMIKYHLDFLKNKKHLYLAEELNISLKEVQRLYQIIKKLQPYPGVNFSSEPTVFIQPDVYIYKQADSFHIVFNKSNLPSLKLSSSYMKHIQKRNSLKKEEYQYLKNKKNSANIFIQTIYHREERIKKTVRAIINYQEDFFKKGHAYLKPLNMTDFAEHLGVNPSTVSRTVSNKYAQTPYGLMALKDFFLKKTRIASGYVSTQDLKDTIKKWIEEENPKTPLSDEQLRKRIELHFKGSISRRMVAQYRIKLKIPEKRQRYRNFLYSHSL
ncbi:MAG: RNA polymerase factor sigma-54 [Bdellovibrionales bacterium]|nr:RNA polymerase factor sigma-54 [Bdellovibrionales bacterium]